MTKLDGDLRFNLSISGEPFAVAVVIDNWQPNAIDNLKK